VGTSLVVMVMLEAEEVHGGLLTDHVRTVVPGVKPVTVVLFNKGLVIVPGPETLIHEPVPDVGAFPANVVDPVLAHMV
jgi:hypothetical protein